MAHKGEIRVSLPQKIGAYPPQRRHLTIAHLLVSMVSWDWINWKRLFIKQYVLTCADLVVALEVLSVFLL